jgi:arabinofuranan 3-O-arabinosyltransferase
LGTRIRRGAIPLALAVAAFALALVQRPGLSSSDTKIDLHTRAAALLADVAHLWTSTAGLGGVEAAQYSGYLFPMGPWFAALHALGVSDWLADRIWLGLLLALGCWGVVRLGDVLFERPRGTAHAVAGLIYLLNPYVVVFSNRTTVTLLAYAALPWLVLFTHRGLRQPRSWRMPAALALVLTASGPGVNAAVVAFVLVGPALLLLFEPFTGAVSWRAVWAFTWRAAVTSIAASIWWLAPAAAQGKYGIDFLKFTEPAGAIWSTTSLTESLRLMGYWIAYIGVGYGGVVRPYFSDAGTLLFQQLVVVASLVVPGVALGGYAWTRRARYAPYLLALVLLGLLLMTVGYPDGTPLRRGVTGAYNHLPSIRFLRTTYKAGPLVALGLAGLGGLFAAMLAERLRARPRVLLTAGGLALLVLAAWPLVRGQAIDRQMVWDRIPAAWTQVARDLDRGLPGDERALVLPGQLYAFYDWGGTVDPILPALTDRPVAVRSATPYGDLHSTDLLWTTDGLVQQERALPGQLTPLVRLLGAGAVVTGADDDFRRSGSIDPSAAARTLAAQGFGAAVAQYGPKRRVPPPAGDIDPATVLPQVRRYRVRDARPAVRLEAPRPAAIVDGSAQGIADLAAFGALRAGAIEYAGDLSAAQLKAAASRGTDVVVSDSNRRRVVVISRMRQNAGATLGPDDPISEDSAVLNPFPARGSAGQTVAILHGARSIQAPFSPGYSQFPEHRPFAAFDGDPRTYWLADPALQPDRHWIEITFAKPLDIPYVDVLPRTDAGAVVDTITTAGRRTKLRAGWNRLRVGLHGAQTLRLLVSARRTGSAGAGGLAEVRIPGVRVTESLRPPTIAESALRGTNLSHTSLTYLFDRATGDSPFRRGSSYGASPSELIHFPDQLEALRVRNPGDAEPAIDRVFSPPAARAWRADAWVGVAPEAADSRLDRLAGYRGAVRIDSSGRFQGQPRFRGSAAFDGSAARAWIGIAPSGAHPWLRWTTPAPRRISRLRLVRSRERIRTPTLVQLRWAGGSSGPLHVSPGGMVELRTPVRARSFELQVLASAFPPGTTASERLREGVAIAEIRGPGVPRVQPVARAAAGRRFSAPCGGAFVTFGGRRIALRVSGSRATFDSGGPLAARSCGPAVELPSGALRLKGGGTDFKVDSLRLRSPAPNPVTAPIAPGRVVDPGKAERGGGRDGVRLDLSGPGTLVLGQSFSDGWRAYCDGRSLGRPRVADGYANGWDVKPPCTRVSFAFAPDRPVRLLQLGSALACLLLLLIALRRAHPRGAARAPAPGGRESREAARERRELARRYRPSLAALRSDRGEPAPWRRALALGLVAALVLGFCFSLRAGVAIFAGVTLIARLGLGPGILTAAAGALLAIVVPLVYVLFPAEDRGGYNPGYAGEHIGAHWVGVAAYTLLAVALIQSLNRARRRRGSPATAPATAAGPRSQP